jgi:hypothetical protein
MKQIGTIILVLLGALSAGATDPHIYSSSRDYISVAKKGADYGPSEEALADYNKNPRKTPIAVGKSLRAKFLKSLDISEGDNLYVKEVGVAKTKIYKISDLEFVYDINSAGEDHIGAYGFKVNIKRRAIAVIGKDNPFNDVVFAELEAKGNLYKIDSKLTLEHKPPVKPKDDEEPLVGLNEFFLRDGRNRKLVLSKDIGPELAPSQIDFYGGAIMKDGAYLILLDDNGCGQFIKFDGKVDETWRAYCGEWGC